MPRSVAPKASGPSDQPDLVPQPIEPDARVDMAAVAASFAGAYHNRRYPGVLLGSSNGEGDASGRCDADPVAARHRLDPRLAVADPQRRDLALQFGRETAPALLDANPDISLHQMHEAAQDELMVARMTYFRPSGERCRTRTPSF